MRVPRLAIAGPMVCLGLVLAPGCTEATAPRSGALRVSLTTTGAEPDPDGYSVIVDGATTLAVGANGSITLTDIAPGTHTVRLEGLAANCSVSGGADRELIVVAGREVTAAFAVSCAPAASVVVSIATTGADIDVAGYVVLFDSDTGRPVGASGTVTIGGLGPGVHTVRLNGVASNCAVGGANPQTVSVAVGETALVSFPVTCVARTGGLSVTAATTGGDIDPDGYTVEVLLSDYYGWTVIASERIGSNGSATFPDLAEGSYSVILDGVAPNCTVAEPVEAAITITLGRTVYLPFTVVCLATGSLRVTNATSGPDPDPNGYTVRVQGARFGGSVSLATGGTATIPKLVVGSYSATIEGVAENCVRSIPATRQVEVVAQTTAVVALNVACTTVSQLAFVSGQGSGAEIYVVNSNGTGTTRLTSNDARDQDPVWSPDGRQIAFTSDRDGNDEIYVMNADGSGTTRLTNNAAPDGRPTWSPDGHRIAFVSARDANLEIFVMDADGTSQARLTNHSGTDTDPAWSPDGRKIAFASDRAGGRDIYTMNADGSGVSRLTGSTPGMQAYSRPAWSPDGKRIAVVVRSPCGYYCDFEDYDLAVLLMNADGSDARSIDPTPALNDAALAWSADGRTLAFSAQACDGGICGISVVYSRVDGSGTDLIVSGGYSPSWRR